MIEEDVLRDLTERYKAARNAPPAEMTPEIVDMVIQTIVEKISQVERSCNLLLLQPKGLPEAATFAIQNLKISTSQMRWFLARAGSNAKP